MRPVRNSLRVVAGVLAASAWLALSGCAPISTFDADAHLTESVEAKVPEHLADRIVIPYELPPDYVDQVTGRISPTMTQKKQIDQILDLIFGEKGLQYSLTPTRTAVDTWQAGEANCLSFVHLFVGIARSQHLNPFYVEVDDYQRWSYEAGTVISRGHIVAGMYVDGDLATYDFLPYRAKGYREFDPIDDISAMAHHYNNLGAEALLRGDVDVAEPNLEIATALWPDFDKAQNNLGVFYLRTGQAERAKELFELARVDHPESVPILNNLARAYQALGDADGADSVMAVLDTLDNASPFFYLYKGHLALTRGDPTRALEHMRNALRLDTEIPEIHVGLVKVYIAMGELGKAQHHVERALKLDATHQEARKYAAMLQRGTTPAGVQSSSGGGSAR